MAQRKELLKAHAFTQQRLVAALVDRDPDNPTPPLRRLGLGTFVSVLVAAALVGGFALFGYLAKPSTNAWAQNKPVVIVDTDSGVVFFTLDGTTIYPATNMASARLITGGDTIVKTTTASLASAPRGDQYGIVGAPAQLPDKSTMKSFPLRVCSLPTALRSSRYTVLDFVAPAATSDTAIGLQVGDHTYVVVNGIAHLVPDGSPLLGTATLLKGTEAFLRSLPQGQEVKPFSDPTRGNKAQRGQNLVGTIVYTGDQTDKAGWSYYIQLIDGYSPISYLDAMVNSQTPTAAEAAFVASNRSDTQNSATPGLPMGPVTFSSTDTTKTTVCATYTADSPDPKVTIGDAVAPPADAKATPAVGTYDRVTTAPGGGALLRSFGTDADGATFLIWQGQKYGIPDLESRTSLGYSSGVDIGTVQPSLLSLVPDGLPAGIALDRTHANRKA
jgi:type VII secretion protein EccB